MPDETDSRVSHKALAVLRQALRRIRPAVSLGPAWQKSRHCEYGARPRARARQSLLSSIKDSITQLRASTQQLESVCNSTHGSVPAATSQASAASLGDLGVTDEEEDDCVCVDGGSEAAQGQKSTRPAPHAAGAASSVAADQTQEAGTTKGPTSGAGAAADAETHWRLRDQASQMRGILYALERMLPEFEDMQEENDMASQMPSQLLDFMSKSHFTCNVCFDDEVDVQDAFVITACGHPLCRPCAVRSVDFNIKQLKPQACPTCLSAPCPLCPITVWQRTQDLQARRSARRRQRLEELHPPPATSRGAGSTHAPEPEQQHAKEATGDPPAPQVKFCCISQANMRLLLQPEELQQQQVRHQQQRARLTRQQGQQEQQREGAGRGSEHGAGAEIMSLVSDSDHDEGPAARWREGESGQGGAAEGQAQAGGSMEEEPAGELPPTYKAYLKAEALRAAHAGGLFKLCPKCGEGIELLASGLEKNRLCCPTCSADKCLECGVDWHEDSTCEQYQQWSRENVKSDEEFKKLIASGQVMPCPQCGAATVKEPGGCDHMRCKCGCYYCYKCGKQKTGADMQNHGCPCMNGAAWRHDWRAQLDPSDPRLQAYNQQRAAQNAAAAQAQAQARAAAAVAAAAAPRAQARAPRAQAGAPAEAGLQAQAGPPAQAGAPAPKRGQRQQKRRKR